MKKTLLALGLASVMAAPAMAADVEIYGLIDEGLTYLHTDSDTAGIDDTDQLKMDHGLTFGSRWGIRGTEDLGNGLKVGFTLESGIEPDTGKADSKQGGRLFGREASLNVSGNFGTVRMGRMPIFGSVLGADGLFRALDPMNANYTDAMGSGLYSASMWTRVDNAISYRSPTFNGFTAYAMYSFQNDANQAGAVEGKSSSDRYGSLALRYKGGAFEGVFVADTTNWANVKGNKDTEDDGYTFTLGGNYTFENGLKVIGWAQYWNNQNLQVRSGVSANALTEFMKKVNGVEIKRYGYGFVDGWGAGLGINYPVLGGTAKAAVYYRDMDNTKDVDFTRYGFGAGYDYPLSKRTVLYGLTGWTQEKIEATGQDTVKPSGYQLSVGLVHRF